MMPMKEAMESLKFLCAGNNWTIYGLDDARMQLFFLTVVLNQVCPFLMF